MRCPALFLAFLLTACGARSPLDPGDRPSNASPDADAGSGPACAAVGSPCTSTDDCCNASCDEQLCGGPPCRPGDPPVTLASGQAEPYNIAIDQGAVYFTNLDKAGSVMAVPKRGGSTTTIAADQDHPESVAVDGASVYWTSSGQGFVGRASKDGASQVKLATAQSAPSGIALDASSVYWVNYLNPGSVSAVPKLGGAPAVLATGGTGFSRVAVDDANVTLDRFLGSSGAPVPRAVPGPPWESQGMVANSARRPRSIGRGTKSPIHRGLFQVHRGPGDGQIRPWKRSGGQTGTFR